MFGMEAALATKEKHYKEWCVQHRASVDVICPQSRTCMRGDASEKYLQIPAILFMDCFSCCHLAGNIEVLNLDHQTPKQLFPPGNKTDDHNLKTAFALQHFFFSSPFSLPPPPTHTYTHFTYYLFIYHLFFLRSKKKTKSFTLLYKYNEM